MRCIRLEVQVSGLRAPNAEDVRVRWQEWERWACREPRHRDVVGRLPGLESEFS